MKHSNSGRMKQLILDSHVTSVASSAPESDGAAAQADVVRGGWPGHGTRLGPTFTPPTAPKMRRIFRSFNFITG